MPSSDNSAGKLPGRIAAACFWIALWAVLAACVGNDLLLAGPVATLQAFGAMLVSQTFWSSVALSGCRIVGASVASAAVGIVLGFIAAHVRPLEVLLEIPIQIMKSAPVACVVVVLLVMVGSVGAIVAIVAFVALPPFYVASLQAARVTLDDGARVLQIMGLSKPALFFAHTWPAILPLYRQAAKTAVALSWRAGITGELLSIPLGSMGAAIYASKLTLDTPALLAWTAVIMLLAFICEIVTLGLLDLSAVSPKLALRMRRGKGKGVLSQAGAAKGENEGALFVQGEGEGASPAAEPVLNMQALAKSYGQDAVLEDVTLALEPDERICLMAPTGAGKTTLLRIALGIESPDAGTVEAPVLCGVALQQSQLIDNLTAWENVLLVADARRSESDMRRQLCELLPADAPDRPADALSGGTKRLAEIARALFSRGSCILLDEPFAGLDPAARERACAFILLNLAGRPLIVATHEIDDAALLRATVVEL